MRIFRSLTRYGCGVAALTAMAGLVACGGGGDGGSSGGGLTYSGIETPAVITQENAGQLTAEAYNGGDISETLGGAFSAVRVDTGDAASPAPRPLVIAALVDQILAQAKEHHFPADGQAAANTAPLDPILGPCGGSAVMSITGNDISLISGSMRFNSYCDDDVVINGLTSFSIIGEQMTMSFSALDVDSLGDDFTISGDVFIDDITASEQTMVMDMVMQDNISGQMVKMQDYRMTLIEELTYTSVTMSGQFYDSEQGYVDLVTLSDLLVDHNSEWPRAGVIKATGEAGCNAILTALDGATYRLEVDEDGNGEFEHTEEGNWSEL